MRLVEVNTMKRAARVVYRTHRINRLELDMLASIALYMLLYQRTSRNKKELLEFSYINNQKMGKDVAVFHSLVDKYCLDHIYVGRGLSYFITDKGYQVLDMYEREMAKVEDWFQTKTDIDLKDRSKLGGYRVKMEGKTF